MSGYLSYLLNTCTLVKPATLTTYRTTVYKPGVREHIRNSAYVLERFGISWLIISGLRRVEQAAVERYIRVTVRSRAVPR